MSRGKCAPCKIGGKSLARIWKIAKGNGTVEHIDTMRRRGGHEEGSLAPWSDDPNDPPSLDHFHDEYLAHIVDKKCPAGKQGFDLHDLRTSAPAVPLCPVNAISGARKEVHVIDQNACIQCGACYETCRFDAIEIR